MPDVRLREVRRPELLVPERQPLVGADEYQRRVDALRERVDADVILVYADREHYANLSFLCGIDPRFEEVVLAVPRAGQPSLVLGTEGLALEALAQIDVAVVHCPSLGLMGQDRAAGRTLREALTDVGVVEGAQVALVGWKYFEPGESGLASPSFAAAAFLVDAVRELAGQVVDATEALINPRDGLRTTNSADQIAAFEWAAARASRAVFAVVDASRPGTSEREAVSAMGYDGGPLSAHVMFASGPGVGVGLRSPTDRVLEAGDGVTVAIGYWGGLCCRAGRLDQPDGHDADDFLERLAKPYWRAVATWWESMRLGRPGGELHELIHDALGGSGIRPALNPGHLGHLDEWVHTPIRPGSPDPIRSGALFQCDIIPVGAPAGWAANCEDALAVADEPLRDELRDRHPDVWTRIERRRELMQEQLGLSLADEILPLCAAPAYFPPFWLALDHVLVAR